LGEFVATIFFTGAVALLIAFNACAQSVVLTQAAAVAVGSLSAKGELDALRERLQRRNLCEIAAEAENARADAAGEIPKMIVCGRNESLRGAEIPPAMALPSAIADTHRKPRQFGVRSVIGDDGLAAKGPFASKGDPANIQTWLR
jgi:hypothetical protein